MSLKRKGGNRFDQQEQGGPRSSTRRRTEPSRSSPHPLSVETENIIDPPYSFASEIRTLVAKTSNEDKQIMEVLLERERRAIKLQILNEENAAREASAYKYSHTSAERKYMFPIMMEDSGLGEISSEKLEFLRDRTCQKLGALTYEIARRKFYKI